jgi:FkbM family methyltransferase
MKLETALRVAAVVWQHPANSRHKFRALAKAIGWQAYKRVVRRPLNLHVHNGLRFRCYPDSHDAGRLIYFNGRPDPNEMTFMERYLRASDTVIDVGASIGIYTLLAARLVGRSGRVFAFEPTPESCRRLQEKLALNVVECVTVQQSAVSDRCGTMLFTADRDTANHFTFDSSYAGHSISVPVTTLDATLRESTCSLVKIDAEGAEPLILNGARSAIAQRRMSVLQLELGERFVKRAGSSVHEIRDGLVQSGYRLWTYAAKENQLLPWTSPVRRQPGHAGDVLAIAESELERVQQRLRCADSAGLVIG